MSYSNFIEAKKLRATYNELLRRKESFVDTTLTVTLTSEQKAEADLTLAMLTGELKRLDAAIQGIAFPNHVEAISSGALSFAKIAKHQEMKDDSELREMIDKQKDIIINLSRNLSLAKNRLSHYKYTKPKMFLTN